MPITTLADFDIGIMAGRGNMALALANFEVLTLQVLQQFLVVKLPIPAIDLWNLCFEFCEVSLRQATHHKELLDSSFGLCLGEFKDGVDTLLLRIIDESAGIYNDDLTLRVIAIVRTLIAVGLHQAHQHLTVYEVLRAPK
jgi:hypothetical protein